MLARTALTDFRGLFTECSAVAFVDISTSMVLATDSSATFGQEVWDEIADTAVKHLNSSISSKIANLLSSDKAAIISYAILAIGTEFRVMVRSSVDPAFAICSMVTSDINIDSLLSQSEEFVNQLANNV